jgi:hypothetical protein
MKDVGLTLTAPGCVLIIFCGFALLFGTDPWLVAKATAICVPVVAYVVFSIFTVIWAIKVGEVGVRQEMTFQAKLYFWHGVSVILTIVLAAAGSFIVLFATQIRGLVGGLTG